MRCSSSSSGKSVVLNGTLVELWVVLRPAEKGRADGVRTLRGAATPESSSSRPSWADRVISNLEGTVRDYFFGLPVFTSASEPTAAINWFASSLSKACKPARSSSLFLTMALSPRALSFNTSIKS